MGFLDAYDSLMLTRADTKDPYNGLSLSLF